MKRIIMVAFLCAAFGFASVANAVDSRVYNGKTFYKVDSTNPSLDSGNEVCAAIGETCIGYPERTNAVCGLFHPSATLFSSSSGDRSGVYCNGPPQGGVCATRYNTCAICPACSVGVSCAQAIGGLYREMFVECTEPAPPPPPPPPPPPDPIADGIYDWNVDDEGFVGRQRTWSRLGDAWGADNELDGSTHSARMVGITVLENADGQAALNAFFEGQSAPIQDQALRVDVYKYSSIGWKAPTGLTFPPFNDAFSNAYPSLILVWISYEGTQYSFGAELNGNNGWEYDIPLVFLGTRDVPSWNYSNLEVWFQTYQAGANTPFDYRIDNLVIEEGVPLPNQPPTADAGPDQAVFDVVSLDGRLSTDTDGQITQYQWDLQHRENSANDRQVSDIDPEAEISNLQPGYYDVTLTVVDDDGASGEDMMLLAASGECDTADLYTQEEVDQSIAAAVAELEGEISSLNSTIDDRDETISAQQGQIVILETTISGLQGDIISLNSTIASMFTAQEVDTAIAANCPGKAEFPGRPDSPGKSNPKGK